MYLRADNFTVSTMLLLAATLFMMGLRLKRPVEDNWPLFYWMGLLAFATTQFGSFKLEIVFVGLVTGLMLRFEFMNEAFERILKTVEYGVWCYVLVRGMDLILV